MRGLYFPLKWDHQFSFFSHLTRTVDSQIQAQEKRHSPAAYRQRYPMTDSPDPFWKTADDARQYDEFTKTTFTRIYPVIANQILDRTGITTGTCLDVGSGPAPLAIAVALLSNLRVTALDSSREMHTLAVQNVRA